MAALADGDDAAPGPGQVDEERPLGERRDDRRLRRRILGLGVLGQRLRRHREGKRRKRERPHVSACRASRSRPA